MTTFSTVEELIEIIRADTTLRDRLRAELLTPELLALPATLAGFIAATDRRFESLEREARDFRQEMYDFRQETHNFRQEMYDFRQETRSSIDAINHRLDTHEEKLDEHSADIRRLTNDVAHLRGDSLEAKLPGIIPPRVVREFGVKRPYVISSARNGADYQRRGDEFDEKIAQAADAGVISVDEETRVRVTDLILRSQRQSDNSSLWFAVEASGVIVENDIIRARTSANAIARVYEQDAVPIVCGYRIHPSDEERAEQADVHVFIEPE